MLAIYGVNVTKVKNIGTFKVYLHSQHQYISLSIYSNYVCQIVYCCLLSLGRVGIISVVSNTQTLTPRPEGLGPNMFTDCDERVAESFPMIGSDHRLLIGRALCRWREKYGVQTESLWTIHPPRLLLDTIYWNIWYQSALTQASP